MDFKGLSDPVVIFNKPEKKPGIFQKIKPPSTDFFKNKKFLGGALTVMLLFAVGLGVFLSQKPTQLAPQANLTTAEISIKPPTQTVNQNQEFQADVFLDTKGLAVTVAQVQVNFDNSALQLINVVPGDFLPTVLSAPANTANSTKFTVLSNPAKTGSGKIATLTFKALTPTTGNAASIGFDSTYTQAAANGQSNNVASGFTASAITITSTSSPQPSASMTTSPSPSPSPSASPQPSASSTSCQNDNQCSNGYYCALTGGGCPDGTSTTCVDFGTCQPRTSPQPTPSSPPTNTDKGDGNSDGTINLQDLSALFSKWSPAIEITSHFQLDFNDDKKINSFDYAKMNELLKSLGVIRQ